MNKLAFRLFGRLQADRYVLVSVVDLRRLRCDRVVMKLLYRGSLVLRFRHRHSLHEVMQVQLWTLDMRNLLAVLGICSWICTKKSLIVGQQISYNTIPPGEDMLYYVHVHTERVLAHWLLEIQISRSRSHHVPFDRLAPQRQQQSRVSTAPA